MERKGFRMMVFGRFLPAGVQNHYVSTRGNRIEKAKPLDVFCHPVFFFTVMRFGKCVAPSKKFGSP